MTTSTQASLLRSSLQARAAYRQRRSSNANSLCSQKSAGSRESDRPFKGIFYDDVSEFESYMPSHAVWSPPLDSALSARGAIIRNPSCLISCSHWPPDGNFVVLMGGHGAMNPAGRVRCNMKSIAKGYSRAFQSFWIARLTL